MPPPPFPLVQISVLLCPHAACEALPLCYFADETAGHFLFDCIAYRTDRRALWAALRAVVPHHVATFDALPPPPLSPASSAEASLSFPRLAAFLTPEFWSPPAGGRHPFHLLATFVAAAWRARCSVVSAALTGREAQEGDPLGV